MGWVVYERMTGDNDPELEPTPVTEEAFYCDHCGSFKFENWYESRGAGALNQQMEQVERRQSRWSRVLMFSFLGLLVWVAAWFFDAQNRQVGIGLGILFGLSLFGYLASAGQGQQVRDQLKIRGSKCCQCGATYSFTSPTVQDRKHNPRGLTQNDIPKIPMHFPGDPKES
ncbi:MAG: hypothetical protein H6510_03415 [Acidobacteria bacterium]|nr:hypothetical protein [Acidobacteriota bacterium]MCB9396847.1 hypothetical protein [Acidobacteriota bacterium]